jgi:hypothetical protein
VTPRGGIMMLALLFAAQIAAASPVVTVPATADLSIAGANLPAGACSGGASSTAHFSIAGRAFQAPRERVNDVVPADPRIVGMHAGGAVDLEMSAPCGAAVRDAGSCCLATCCAQVRAGRTA